MRILPLMTKKMRHQSVGGWLQWLNSIINGYSVSSLFYSALGKHLGRQKLSPAQSLSDNTLRAGGGEAAPWRGAPVQQLLIHIASFPLSHSSSQSASGICRHQHCGLKGERGASDSADFASGGPDTSHLSPQGVGFVEDLGPHSMALRAVCCVVCDYVINRSCSSKNIFYSTV